MLLVIDNYDSFTYNLVQYFGELGVEQSVHRNDSITVEEALALKPDRLMISPGPCSPNEAGVSLAMIEAFSGKIPILGVCLGHQSIGQYFGGRVVRADRLMHGKTSKSIIKGAIFFWLAQSDCLYALPFIDCRAIEPSAMPVGDCGDESGRNNGTCPQRTADMGRAISSGINCYRKRYAFT